MARVLVVSHDPVGPAMAGPAIRSYEISAALAAAGHQVILSAPGSADLQTPGFTLRRLDPAGEGLRGESEWAEVVVVQGFVLEQRPWLRRGGSRLVVDLYDPFHLEYLAAVHVASDRSRYVPWKYVLGALDEQARMGDFFLCASERQRDFWLGSLAALGRVNLATYSQDLDLRRLIDVVPFGLPATPPARTGPGLRESVPGVGADDLVLLWGGGIYDWFDPLSLIRGVGLAAARVPNLRLVFLSASHPNPDVPRQDMLGRARLLAAELDPEGRHVFFNERWVPYDQRANWLLDADLGVSTHFEHLETRFSFRTRILDYFWAGLPTICTAGDSLAAVIEAGELGITVAPEDPSAIADAIVALAADPQRRGAMAERVRAHAAGLTWERAVAPLARWCAGPAAAADLRGLADGEALPVPLRSNRERRRRVGDSSRVGAPLSERVVDKLREEGAVAVARAAARRLRRRA